MKCLKCDGKATLRTEDNRTYCETHVPSYTKVWYIKETTMRTYIYRDASRTFAMQLEGNDEVKNSQAVANEAKDRMNKELAEKPYGGTCIRVQAINVGMMGWGTVATVVKPNHTIEVHGLIWEVESPNGAMQDIVDYLTRAEDLIFNGNHHSARPVVLSARHLAMLLLESPAVATKNIYVLKFRTWMGEVESGEVTEKYYASRDEAYESMCGYMEIVAESTPLAGGFLKWVDQSKVITISQASEIDHTGMELSHYVLTPADGDAVPEWPYGRGDRTDFEEMMDFAFNAYSHDANEPLKVDMLFKEQRPAGARFRSYTLEPLKVEAPTPPSTLKSS